jgi:type IV pilus assembly protein PilB
MAVAPEDGGRPSDLDESDASAALAAPDSEIHASVVPTPAAEDTVGDEASAAPPEITEATSDRIDEIVELALSLGASSIHFSPQPDGLVVRARVDGVIRELERIPTGLEAAVTARLRTSPRASLLSTKHGDRLTLDLRHEAPPSLLALGELGLAPDHEQMLRAAIDQPYGLILVCGPARSGRTTTVYGALQELNTSERAAITVEDPVAQLVPGLDQIEVDPSAGITFARGVRTILRSDPDVILVGEIRDRDTAVATLGAAATGHLVLSTLHAGSTAGAVRRLTDLGVGAGLLGSTLTCLVAQRLARRICLGCRESYYPSADELAELGRPAEESGRRLLARGRGCASCGGSGYAGRVGLFEALPLTEEIRELLIAGASTAEIEREAVAAGMRTLLEDGARLCLDGLTTADEVRRVHG